MGGQGSRGEKEHQREGPGAPGLSRPLTWSLLYLPPQTAKLTRLTFPLSLPTHLLEVFPSPPCPETYTLEG